MQAALVQQLEMTLSGMCYPISGVRIDAACRVNTGDWQALLIL